MKRVLFSMLFLAALIFLLSATLRAQTIESSENAASGGAFVLQKTVVAGGGREMQQQPSTNIHGTAGQANAGVKSMGGQFSVYSGFWTPDAFAPTSANVVVGGRILTADRRGIKNVRVEITFPSGETRTTISNAFGYYRFAEIPSGEIYIFTVFAKRFHFTQPTQSRTIVGDTQEIDFIAASPEKAEQFPQPGDDKNN